MGISGRARVGPWPRVSTLRGLGGTELSPLALSFPFLPFAARQSALMQRLQKWAFIRSFSRPEISAEPERAFFPLAASFLRFTYAAKGICGMSPVSLPVSSEWALVREGHYCSPNMPFLAFLLGPRESREVIALSLKKSYDKTMRADGFYPKGSEATDQMARNTLSLH